MDDMSHRVLGQKAIKILGPKEGPTKDIEQHAIKRLAVEGQQQGEEMDIQVRHATRGSTAEAGFNLVEPLAQDVDAFKGHSIIVDGICVKGKHEGDANEDFSAWLEDAEDLIHDKPRLGTVFQNAHADNAISRLIGNHVQIVSIGNDIRTSFGIDVHGDETRTCRDCCIGITARAFRADIVNQRVLWQIGKWIWWVMARQQIVRCRWSR